MKLLTDSYCNISSGHGHSFHFNFIIHLLFWMFDCQTFFSLSTYDVAMLRVSSVFLEA